VLESVETMSSDDDSTDDDSNSDDQTTVKHVEEKSENIIETQKNRAMVLWQHWYHLGNFNETVYSEVMKKLKNGEVPSIFHTLCRSVDERLFLPDTKFDYMKTISGDTSTSKETIVENIPIYIYLSAKTVEVGVALCRVAGEISSNKPDSYLKGFFCDDNKMARVHIVDHQLSNKWTFDEEYTRIVTNLVNAPAKMVGHDVEVTRLKAPFYLDRKSGKNLITRSLSRGVVADCFRRSKCGGNHGIVGNPGIGKSWTLLYALQQAMLYENVCVMICFQNHATGLVCIRKDNRIYVWDCMSSSLKNDCYSGLFRNSNVLVLLEPLERGASYIEGSRRLIFAASNHEKHFRNNPGKATGDWQRILNPFSDHELTVALPYIMKEPRRYNDNGLPTLEKMIRRSKKVGNMPWYLFSKDLYNKRISERSLWMDYVKWNYKNFSKVLFWGGITDDTTARMNSVFAVHAGVEDFGTPITDFGYDGQHGVNYGKMVISTLVPNLKEQLLTNWREWILSYTAKNNEKYLAHIGIKLADLFWMDLQKGGVIMKSWKTNEFGKYAKPATLRFPSVSCHMNVEIDELGEKAFYAAENTVCRMVVGGRGVLIDFAGPGRQVYKIMAGETDALLHYDGIKRLLICGGLLEGDQNGVVTEVTNLTNPRRSKIRFNWVFPVGISKTSWVERQLLVPLQVGSVGWNAYTNYEVVQSCFDKYIQQYVIVMDEKPQFQTTRKK
jgi:hypothetical protein